MLDEDSAPATSRFSRWCTRRRLSAGVALAGIAAIGIFAAASATGASSAGGGRADALRASGASSDASVLGSLGLAPKLTEQEGATLAAIEKFVQIAAQPTATVPPTATAIPPTATAVPPTSTPHTQPSPARPIAVNAPPTTAAPTSTPVPPPAPPAQPTGLDTSPMDAQSQALFDATNRHRASENLPPLRANGYLVGIARIRSQDMADNNYFAHVSPVTGDNAFMLMDKHGVPYGWAGENIAKNNYPTNEFESVADVALWNSPPHRENIVNTHYTDMGIALAIDASGMKYFTIIFTGPA
jgi:uncharacterized protein YkwD